MILQSEKPNLTDPRVSLRIANRGAGGRVRFNTGDTVSLTKEPGVPLDLDVYPGFRTTKSRVNDNYTSIGLLIQF